MREFLPIGSVVLLKGTEKKLMIIGRVQVCEGTVHKYSAVLYPEGYVGSEGIYLFEEEDIEVLYYIGIQDEEEFVYRKALQEMVEKRVDAVSGEEKKTNQS